MGVTSISLIGATLLPAVLAAACWLAERKTAFGYCSYRTRQIVIGICFGMIAILATEFGIPVDGAVLNVRNAAPLTAGLLFGGPAGIVAGLIGGIERWFSDAGDFTRVACTLGTILAGFISAAVRKTMLDNKNAAWLFGLTVGVVSEVLHMLLVFLSNASDIQRAFAIVQVVAVPMIAANGIAVMLAILAVSWLGKDFRWKEGRNIARTFQRWLLVCVLLGFVVTAQFTNFFQTKVAIATTEFALTSNLEDVRNDIRDVSDRSLLETAKEIRDDLPEEISIVSLQQLAGEHDVMEINLVNDQGIITNSTKSIYEGYDMGSGPQSEEFLVLLEGETEMVQRYQPTALQPSILRKYAGVVLEGGGFLQVGYDGQRLQEHMSEQVRYVAKNRRIGQEGNIIVCDAQGIIVSDREGHEGERISKFESSAELGIPEWTMFNAEIYGKPSCCMYTVAEGYYLLGVMTEDEAFFARDASIYVQSFMEVVVFSALFVMIFFLAKVLVVKNVRKINHSLEEITGGNLDVTVDVRGVEEFAALSDGINTTVTALKHYIDEAAARLDQELEIAKQIQRSALPSIFPPYPACKDFSIYASMEPAKEVGGDFYDFYMLGKHHLAFLMADVSGKGIPAAMFMMNAKALLKSHTESGLGVSEVFTQVNNKLCQSNEAGMFITAWMGILDLETGLVRYANAGHNPPLVKRRDGTYEYLKGRVNLVLAGMEGIRYRQQELQLLPGDEIYLYTDGVTEAHDAAKELFGETRLQISLNETEGMSVEEICKKVKQDVDEFVGDAEQFDDITMLSVRLNEVDSGGMLAVEPTMESVSQVSAFVEEELEKLQVPLKLVHKMLIAVDEIYSNIVRYSGASKAYLRLWLEDGLLELSFRDDGKPYDPLAAKEPDITASADDRPIGGLGIFMVRNMMDRVEYEYTQGMNRLVLELRLPE